MSSKTGFRPNRRGMGRVLALVLALMLILTSCARPHSKARLPGISSTGTVYPAPYPNRRTICYSQMLEEYRRPDLDQMEETAQELMETVNGLSAGASLKALKVFEDQLNEYYQAYSLVSVWYAIDHSDAKAQKEYTFFIDTAQQVQDLSDQLYMVVARGPNVSMLEKNYYGEDFFDDYGGDGEQNSRLAALRAQEDRLVAQYEDLCVGRTILFEGEERSWDELLADANIVGNRWRTACAAYFDKYNPMMGEIYLELLQVRDEIAQLSGYRSYADYAYEGFGRDYTQRQAKAYMDDVVEWLLPLYQAAGEEGLWYEYTMDSPLAEKDVRSALKQTLGEIDQDLVTIWEYMETYELANLTSSPNKVSGAFETYLRAYQAPFLVANLDGVLEDLLTVAHEFGHFCDDFINWGVTYNMDVAESCSQGLEYLILEYLDEACTKKQVQQLLGGKLLDTLDLYIWQGLYNAFEDEVYAQDVQELTVEDLNDIYAQVCQRFGMEEDGGVGYYSKGWIDITHFFQQPFYIISYVVSNDIAMQLWTLEQEHSGQGVAAYLKLLDRDDPLGSLEDVAEEIGLESPFARGRVEEVARAVGQALKLEQALPAAA